MTTLTISVPETMRKFIKSRVKQDGYGTVSEFIRNLIREEQKRLAQTKFNDQIREGLESEEIEMTPAAWNELKRDLRKQVRARKTS